MMEGKYCTALRFISLYYLYFFLFVSTSAPQVDNVIAAQAGTVCHCALRGGESRKEGLILRNSSPRVRRRRSRPTASPGGHFLTFLDSSPSDQVDRSIDRSAGRPDGVRPGG